MLRRTDRHCGAAQTLARGYRTHSRAFDKSGALRVCWKARCILRVSRRLLAMVLLNVKTTAHSGNSSAQQEDEHGHGATAGAACPQRWACSRRSVA